MIVEPFSVNRQLVVRAIGTCLRGLIRIVNDHLSGRLASLKVACGTVVLSLLTTLPFYQTIKRDVNNPNNPTIAALRIKTQNPLSPIPDDLKEIKRYGPGAAHIDELELRLTVPILGWLSGTGAWTVVIWSHLSALGVFLSYCPSGEQSDR